MGTVWGHAGSVWCRTSRTHELLSLGCVPGTVLGSVGLEISLIPEAKLIQLNSGDTAEPRLGTV